MNGPRYFPGYFLMALGLILALLFRAVPAQADELRRGLGFLAYLSIQRGMTEGDVRAAAGKPDLVVDQGFAPDTTMVVYDADDTPRVERLTLLVRTYTYLATREQPSTTITFIGGRVNEIERGRTF